MKLIIDSKRFLISVEAKHSDYSRIKLKFKELIGTILIRTVSVKSWVRLRDFQVKGKLLSEILEAKYNVSLTSPPFIKKGETGEF